MIFVVFYVVINRSVGLHFPASVQRGALFDCGPIREVVFSSRDISVSLPYNSSFDRLNRGNAGREWRRI